MVDLLFLDVCFEIKKEKELPVPSLKDLLRLLFISHPNKVECLSL
jgi:hypothetical protein